MIPPMNPQRYPIGIQSFSEIREGGYLYVDKTDLIYHLMQRGANYIFLFRPHGFGKTLLLSTFKAYFEGRKDLFEGLTIEQLETEWKEYPVLYFDLSHTKRMNKEELEAELMRQMAEYEKVYGVDEVEEKYTNLRLMDLVWRTHEKTGKRVVILIDDYDASFLDENKDEKKVGSFWFDDDLKAYLKATLKKYDAPLEELENERAGRSELYVPMEMICYSTPILFQMGLLTIKNYKKIIEDYTLGIPNEEARNLLKASQP